MGTPFVVDDKVVASLKALRALAESNPVSEQEMRDAVMSMQAGNYRVSQRNIDQTITLPFGYTLTFTHEWQPAGMARHVSMASPRADRIPLMAAMEMVLGHLGFESAIFNSWIEPMRNGGAALNVLEIIE